MHHQLYSALVGFGRTASYAAIIQTMQERLVDKYVEKQQKKQRYASFVEATSTTNEQLDRIAPYLELKACRATPLSFIRGQLKVDALQARVQEATEAVKMRSSEFE